MAAKEEHMRKAILSTATIAILALPACEGMTTQERTLMGGLTGAAVGYLTADALNANDEWTILATLGGAAIGALVARNDTTGECAYARGDGTYRVGPCPRG
jgi:osmotically inducible lipoprotein OsmB